jgi:predicted nuclease of predicted toxin-antitoxin system
MEYLEGETLASRLTRGPLPLEQFLLLVSTGNTSNEELERMLSANLPAIMQAFETSVFVELGRSSIVVHGR